MLMNQENLEEALELIPFTKEQQQAVEAVWHQMMQNPLLKRMADEDAAQLANPQGSERIEADEKQLATVLGELADVYPVLILLSRVDWLKRQYARLGIDEALLRGVLSDIPLWMTNYEAHTGRTGLREYTWLTNHLRMRLFRLGRLEYIMTKSRVPAWFYRSVSGDQVIVLADNGLCFDSNGQLCTEENGQKTVYDNDGHTVIGFPIDPLGCIQAQRVSLQLDQWQPALAPGDPVLDVHIPQGPPMTPEAITASLEAAIPFYRDRLGLNEERAFTCSSWLMSPALREILSGSNLAAFQQRFRIAPYTLRDNQVFERVYGHGFTSWEEMPMQTRLQRGVRDWYLAGGKICQMQGVILREEMETVKA